MAGAAINIVLDPIFIFVCKWGMMGAAVATVIGQIATAGLAVWYLLHMKIIKPASADYVLKKNICAVSYTHLSDLQRVAFLRKSSCRNATRFLKVRGE